MNVLYMYLVVVAAITVPMIVLTAIMCFVLLEVTKLTKGIDNLGEDIEKLMKNLKL